LHGNLKSDAVPDSWLTFCVLFRYTCCKRKRNVLGRNWSQTAYLRSQCTVRWDRTVRFGTVLLLIPYYTVKATIRHTPYRTYGVILEIRRSATDLFILLDVQTVYVLEASIPNAFSSCKRLLASTAVILCVQLLRSRKNPVLVSFGTLVRRTRDPFCLDFAQGVDFGTKHGHEGSSS